MEGMLLVISPNCKPEIQFAKMPVIKFATFAVAHVPVGVGQVAGNGRVIVSARTLTAAPKKKRW